MIRFFLGRSALCLALGLLLTGLGHSSAQTLTVTGVANRTSYRDQASFIVQTNAGFTYDVTLNGKPVPAGVTNTVLIMDYYDLLVSRTQTSDGTVTNALIRFIVDSSRRASGTTSPELGLIEWVPLPPIPSTAAEVAGATLSVMMPESYPAGLDIPVVAGVVNADGNARRVNGWVTAPGFAGSEFRMLRGVGHGFLPPATNSGTLAYNAQFQGLASNKTVLIEPSTTWTAVSGVLGATTDWPANSRIHITANLTIPATATLTIGAGTVVRLNPGVNITNSGRTYINGTTTQPVVFTSTNRVAPEKPAGAWGGWIMRGPAELHATAAIMTGSGAAPNFSFTPSTSHRSEQPLFLCHSNAMRLTNCALINQAGQIGNGYYASIVYDNCLVQRAITVGEYEGGTNIVLRSAMIEFPSVDGVYNAAIVDADFDGFYTIRSTNFFSDSLFGFAKDDAIDSGSGGAGTFVVTNCWIESATHEALAWSGESRRTWTYDSVLINCGQGLECGWSTTNTTSLVSPIVIGNRILTTANGVGARYGDNYTGTSGLGNKAGFLTLSNSYVLNNYRDVWGQVWDNTWNYRVNQMDIRNNFLTAPNTNHPLNSVFDPAAQAPALAAFMTTDTNAPVGIGLAAWPQQLSLGLFTNGFPVRLSSFTVHPVQVDYAIQTGAGLLASGTLTFAPGETVKRIVLTPAQVASVSVAKVSLSNPVGGEITGDTSALLASAPVTPTTTTLIPYKSTWKYLDDGSNQGTAWRTPAYNDSAWLTGAAELGFGDGDEATVIRRTNTLGSIATFYFRKTITVTNIAQFGTFRLRLLRDDAGIVYINGTEVLRSPNMPAGEVAYNVYTGGTAPPDNTVDTTNLVNNPLILSNGVNLVAAEVHQQASTSSDASFDLELVATSSSGIPLYSTRFDGELVLYWGDPTYRLESATNLSGPWTAVPGAVSPFSALPTEERRFYRLVTP